MLQRCMHLAKIAQFSQIVKSYTSLAQHKWLDYDETHKKSLQTHKSRAEEFIHKIPIIEVDSDVVRCLGGTHINAGHPQVYIKLDTRTEGTPQTCKYCGLQYVKKGHGLHHH
ncbi:unnamed protein product [Paramecium primaurelia]|uniref:Zinc finger CHCC-type domain-containing protein n=1 Tax=Paramecium primaurelia TaxID=5886 RepID=A0A8S1KR30_PARPR|nr:unnamed protein product [Paramecium primaurelia]